MSDTNTTMRRQRALRGSAFLILAMMVALAALTGFPPKKVEAKPTASERLSRISVPISHPIPREDLLRRAVAEVELPDPFEQLTKIGIDGSALRVTAETLGIDVTPVSTVDLSRIELDDINAEDRKCLTQAIYYEARNQSVAGQMAVADVVLNRVASKRYPNSICGVVFQGSKRSTGCQFSFTCDGSMDKAVERSAMIRSQILATAILGGFRLPLSQEATNYHAKYVNPYWAPKLYETAKIDDHVFYKRSRPVRVAMVN